MRYCSSLVCLSALILLSLFRDIGASASGRHSEFVRPSQILLYKKLETTFPVRGELWEATPVDEGGNLPLEASLRLYLKVNSKFKYITTLSDLSNFVRISTKKQALEFVQLKTSANTFYLFHEPYSDTTGVDIDWSAVEQRNSHNKFPPLKIIKMGTTYLIMRPLFRGRESSYIGPRIIYVTERIGSRGQYKLMHNASLGTPSAFGLRQSIPGFL
jgi:hypothetical protein